MANFDETSFLKKINTQWVGLINDFLLRKVPSNRSPLLVTDSDTQYSDEVVLAVLLKKNRTLQEGLKFNSSIVSQFSSDRSNLILKTKQRQAKLFSGLLLKWRGKDWLKKNLWSREEDWYNLIEFQSEIFTPSKFKTFNLIWSRRVIANKAKHFENFIIALQVKRPNVGLAFLQPPDNHLNSFKASLQQHFCS